MHYLQDWKKSTAAFILCQGYLQLTWINTTILQPTEVQ